MERGTGHRHGQERRSVEKAITVLDRTEQAQNARVSAGQLGGRDHRISFRNRGERGRPRPRRRGVRVWLPIFDLGPTAANAATDFRKHEQRRTADRQQDSDPKVELVAVQKAKMAEESFAFLKQESLTAGQ